MRLSEKYLEGRVALLNRVLDHTGGKFVLNSSSVYGYSVNFRYESTAETTYLTGAKAGEVDAWLSGAIEMALSFKGGNGKFQTR